MNREEIEEIETLKIDFKDTDELELALEVSSKKAIYLINDLIKHLFEWQQEKQELKKENKILRENAEHNDKVVDKVNWENQELKKQFEEYKHKGLYNTCLPYSTGYKKAIKEKENQQKEFIEWLENEKNIYPYDVSDYTYEDIIDAILSKYNEIIGSDSKW